MVDELYDGGFGGFAGLRQIILNHRNGPNGERALYISGHSLGGALTRMLMLKIADDGLARPGDRVYTVGAPWVNAFLDWIDKFYIPLAFHLGPDWQLGVDVGGRRVSDFNSAYAQIAVIGAGVRDLFVEGDVDTVSSEPERQAEKIWNENLATQNGILDVAEDLVNDVLDGVENTNNFIAGVFGFEEENTSHLDFELKRPVGFHRPFATSRFPINCVCNPTNGRPCHSVREYTRYALERLKAANQGYYFPNGNSKVRKPLEVFRLN